MTGERATVVVGDVGGQPGSLSATLERLGVVGGALPDGMTVVQVGDVVRAGEPAGLDSGACARMVDRMVAGNPGRWVQLLGNHEAALLGGPRRASWRPRSHDSADAAGIVSRWWREGSCSLAYAHDDGTGPGTLVTHAGLSRARWVHLGCPRTAADAAAAINRDMRKRACAFLTGGLLTGRPTPADGPDVTWAETSRELYGPWLDAGAMPFAQAHGHGSPWNWGAGGWWPETPDRVRAAVVLEPECRRVRLPLPGGGFTGVDWMLGDSPNDFSCDLLTL